MAFDGGHFTSILGETTQLQDEHLVIKYQNDIESDNKEDDKKFKQNLRRIEHNFSEDDDYQKDIQVVIDENYINLFMLNTFHNAHMYSLTEHLIKMWPDEFMGGAGFIKSLMSVAVWELFFPNLSQYSKDN